MNQPERPRKVVRIHPPARPPAAVSLQVPGDKSISHRAALLAAMARGSSTLDGFLTSSDCLATLGALSELGVEIRRQETRVWVKSPGWRAWSEPAGILDLGNSGTGIRLLTAALAPLNGLAVLTGDASLRRRPMGRVVHPLREMGANITGRRHGELAPLVVMGRGWKENFGEGLVGREFRLSVASAQVKTALLLAGLAAQGWTVVEEPAASRDHTERLFRYLGLRIEWEGAGARVAVAGGQEVQPFTLTIPGDISSAAFFLCAFAPLPGAEVVVKRVGVNPTRTGLFAALRRMGARVEMGSPQDAGGEPVADVRLAGAPLVATTIEGAEIPLLIDELPVLAVLATQARGETVIKDAAELRVKESDRIAALARCLGRLGVVVRELPDGLVIPGPQRIRSGRVSSDGDHRIAMAMAVASLWAEGPVEIEDVGWVDTSFPAFFHQFAAVTGARVEEGTRQAPAATITVDGPAGAGKSTVARRLAEMLNYRYLDTGAMYRAVTWKALSLGIDPSRASDEELARVARSSRIELEAARPGAGPEAIEHGRVFLDGRDVTAAVRAPEVNQAVSWMARVPQVREVLVAEQRRLASGGMVVVDGRDAGTVICPEADLKLFITANPAERARRRWLELREQGYEADLSELEGELRRRDQLDSEREVAPLRAAPDAMIIDTSGRSVESVLAEILAECERRGLHCYTGWSGGSGDPSLSGISG